MAAMKRNHNSTMTTDDLHAYVDGNLAPEHLDMVRAYLAANPTAAAEVADYRRINSALLETYDEVLEEPIPSSLVAVARQRHPRMVIPIAAAITGLIVGGSMGWFSHNLSVAENSPLEQLAQRSSAAYVVYSPEKRHPVEVKAVESVYLSTWLSKRMGMSFQIPKLGDLGFELVGGRLMVGEKSPAALLMYENREGRRVVLYVRNDLPSLTETNMQFSRKDGASVVTWSDGVSGFGLAGGFTKQELVSAANLIRAQLS